MRERELWRQETRQVHTGIRWYTPVTKRLDACVRNATAKHAWIVWLDRTAIFKVKSSYISHHHRFFVQANDPSMLSDRFIDPFLYWFCYRLIRIFSSTQGSSAIKGLQNMHRKESRPARFCNVIGFENIRNTRQHFIGFVVGLFFFYSGERI